ncbi:MAG: isoleucine--tRNA ligase [Actinomycetota bacterium]|nr:isoleucine--tRNA ligase [Actinomycetota bacterium]
MDYKNTLNLPKTEFSMKANLATREPEIMKFWDEIDIYRLVAEKRAGAKEYILHDGPPYANGNIHLGHTLNKVLKDIIVKYKSMNGFSSPYVPGWDCHGQPIEHNVEKSLGEKKSTIDKLTLRRLCRDYAMDFVQKQADQFKRLGVRGDFDHPYLTLDKKYEATNIEVFGELYERGHIYKGRKPIHWCYNCKTALAEAEIEYSDEVSTSIFVKFPMEGEFEKLNRGGLPAYIVIWTTTPWTLPANMAIAVHPKSLYVAAKLGGEILIMAKELIESVLDENDHEIVATFSGRDLLSASFNHPFMSRHSRVVLADFVSLDTGSGCVHIAPGHGQDDYLIGLNNQLDIVMPVDDDGFFTKEGGKYSGKHIKEANGEIISDLEEKGLLLSSSSITHSYPHCWRCKKPVIFRATEQWFVSMDDANLRQKALKEIELVDWVPAWSKKRILSMIEERPDWCISRQRSWGVPIPAFFCQECNEELITKETIGAVKDLFEREGADSWFERPESEILPKGTICPKCGKSEFKKEEDILDVWFESGVSHVAVLKKRDDLSWPAELYLEGSDQHRGWFQSSLLTSLGAFDRAPFKTVLTHGFLVDGQGRKMSKSLGNVVDPLEVTRESGADILRLWVSSADYGSDIAISSEILDRISEAYRRIRNTLRFLMGNLYDFNPKIDFLERNDLSEIDRWALSRLQGLINTVTQAYDEFKFHLVFHSIYNFCVLELSSFYLDVLKDGLYTYKAGSMARRSSQTALYKILMTLIELLAPILSFTAEDAWACLPESFKDSISPQLTDWPSCQDDLVDKGIEERFEKLLKLRSDVLRSLEAARTAKLIGNSLEAEVSLYVNPNMKDFLIAYEDILAMIFIVSSVKIHSSTDDIPSEAKLSEETSGAYILVTKAFGQKCERCWNFRKNVGEDQNHLGICSRCLDAIS